MADYVTQALQERLAALKAKLKARANTSGMSGNVEALNEAIDQIEVELTKRREAQ